MQRDDPAANTQGQSPKGTEMDKAQLAQAFVNRETGSCHNAHSNGEQYFLHGNPIATHGDGGKIFVSFCGWFTPTTASHINGVLKAAGKPQRVSYSRARGGKEPESFSA